MLRCVADVLSQQQSHHLWQLSAAPRRWLGTTRDYYEILGVDRSASKSDVKKAYYALAKSMHPDANPGDPHAAEAFNELTVAYRTLVDDVKRRAYDSSDNQSNPSASSQDGASQGQGDAGGAFSVFEQLLREGGMADVLGFGAVGRAVGGAFGFRPSPYSSSSSSASAPHSHSTASLELDLMDAINGISRPVTVPLMVPCATCNGSGIRQQQQATSAAPPTPKECKSCNGSGVSTKGGLGACKRCGGSGTEQPPQCSDCKGSGTVSKPTPVNVAVPLGAADGEVIQAQGPNGEHVLVTLRVKPHPVFRREGADVHVDVPLTAAEAALGCRVKMPSISGTVEIRVRPGTQPGETEVFFNKGVRRAGSIKRGNLIIHFKVVVPKTLTRKAEELYGKVREEESTYGPKTGWWKDAFAKWNEFIANKQPKH